MKIVVIFPTEAEAKYFVRDGVDVFLCGVGIAASTYITTKIIKEHNPDVLIMGGIAGVYPLSKYGVGDTVIIKEENEADLGFFYNDGFRRLSDMSLVMSFELNNSLLCPYVTSDMPLPQATSNTLTCAIAPFVKREGVDVENMEGSGFFYACLKEKKKFFEVRS
ncbi:MAG: hypothetical protein RSB93_06225, partial [Rikenellaceae bacterium]